MSWEKGSIATIRHQYPGLITSILVLNVLQFSEPNGLLYNAAIQGMCLTGRLDLAKKLYTEMRERSLQPDGKTRAMMLQNLPKDSRRNRKRNLQNYD